MAVNFNKNNHVKLVLSPLNRLLLCSLRRLLALIALAFCLLASPLVLADALPTKPDAGQILQQIERDLEPKLAPVQPELPAQAPSSEDEQADKVTIKQFKFKGNKVLSESDLQEAVAPLTNRSISITELKTCTDLVSALYRKKGYLASCSLPEQDITEGVVLIEVVEAVFGGVKFDGVYKRDFIRVKPAVIERFIEAAAPKGVVLNQDKLDKGILLLEGLAGIKVEHTLQAGQADGSTDLLLKVKDQPLFSSQVTLDNTGGRQTGREKLTAMLGLASPFGYGDSLNLTALHSQGTDYARMAYNLPVGAKGLQLGVNGTYMEYDVILADFASQKPNGYSSTLGLSAQYPWWRNKSTKVNIGLEADTKQFTNKSTPRDIETKSSDYDMQVYALTISGEHNDNWLASAQTTASLNIGAGKVDLNGSANQADDLAAAHTSGRFARLRWNASRNQFLTDTILLNVSGSGQFANSNLDSSEKFYLGGLNGVRAYPTSEGAGSEGFMAIAELRKYLANNITVAGFVDYGRIKQFENNLKANGQVIVENNAYSLKGYGASIAWQGPYRTNVKATYAHRFGHNPNPTTTGNDQDGSNEYDVFWLNGGINF
jgi:hemolysin activation/secretion protein